MGLLDRFKKSDKAEAKAQTATAAKPKAITKVKSVAKPAVKTTTASAKISAPVAAYTAVLIRPVVTEKSTSTGAYYFQVAKSASKNEIAKAFKTRFGKMPRKVNIVNVMGKTKARGRSVGKRADWKKAVVYLNKGETVDTSK